MKGHFHELDGKDGRKWKLYSILDPSDMSGLSFRAEDVKKMAYQDIEEGGYTLAYSGYIPLPFISYPLVPESPEGIIRGADCLWCYCVECGHMLTGRSVLAIQFIMGTKKMVVCFEVLDMKMFDLMSNYELNHPFDKMLKNDQLLRAEAAKRRYCLTCGLPDKNPYCSESCKEWHVNLVLMKKNMGMNETEIRRDDEVFREDVNHRGFNDMLSDYVKGMLLYFKQAKFNIYKRLRPPRCQNMLCPTNLPGRKKSEDIGDCCGKCNRATYCSKNCQKLDYEHHKTSCEYWNNVWDDRRLVTLLPK